MRTSLPRFLARACRMTVCLFALVLAALGRPCRADLIVEAGPITASAGSSGSFDILLRNTNADGGDSYALSSDTIQFVLTGTTGVTITGASITTGTPYLFQVSGTTFPGADPFVTSSTPTSVLAGDSEFGDPSYDVVGPHQSFGIAHVTYSIASDAIAGQIGTISLDGTNFSDIDGNIIPVSLVGGTFTVNAVPEPSSLLLAATGLIALVTTRFRSRAADQSGQAG